jgi:hypothetical protein
MYYGLFQSNASKVLKQIYVQSFSKQKRSMRMLLENAGGDGLGSRKYHAGFTFLLSFLHRCLHAYISCGGYGQYFGKGEKQPVNG